ncbi:uncharacterized protein B0P05DRAFT_524626 [Gilbertella persicaria]|uniref:uncharacterized protein n=1 Tax=Gilbertella persicaria TaxID=101096 RepID=UPI002220A59E|nr:uncharacterized protein B0P05DRAFT_524626 [Gilbertella persicaria]KAI8095081.1 hypothetical protein B0P05DRAFT_524626 [Gilbertella persicaria]
MLNRKKIGGGQSPFVIGAFILLLDLWVIYAALVSTRSVAFKIGCIITVTIFPFGGLVLYLPISLLFLS